jgi:hypothetical protein
MQASLLQRDHQTVSMRRLAPRMAGFAGPMPLHGSAATSSWQPIVQQVQPAPRRAMPAEQMMQIPPHNIEAAIAGMRRDNWNRSQAEERVGLPAGTLAAVVDEQGRWLDEAALCEAVKDLLPAEQQEFSQRLESARTNLRAAGLDARVVSATFAATHPLEDRDIDPLIQELLATEDEWDIVDPTPKQHAPVMSLHPAQSASTEINDPHAVEPALAPASSHGWTLCDLVASSRQVDPHAQSTPECPPYVGDAAAMEIVSRQLPVELQGIERASQRRGFDAIGRHEPMWSRQANAHDAKSSLLQRRGMPVRLSFNLENLAPTAQELLGVAGNAVELTNTAADDEARKPDTLQMQEIRNFLNASAREGKDSAFDRYRRALDENERKIEGRWSDTSMQKAAGIDPKSAQRIRYRREPDSPQTTEIRQFLAANVAEDASGTEKYRRALDENERRPEGSQWRAKSMGKAAGIHHSYVTSVHRLRKPDTPRTIAVREFLAAQAPQNATIGEKYRLVLDENERRAEGQKWPEKSMQKAAEIGLSRARDIRNLRAPDSPRTTEIRAFLATTTARNAAEKYRLARKANDERIESQKWPDHSLRKAAGINQTDAAKVRRKLLGDEKGPEARQEPEGA